MKKILGMLRWLRPSENEHGLMFGLSWSAVGFLIAITGLSSCAYLIPSDERPPRYNTVLGQRRAPLLNNAVGENAPDATLPVAKQVQTAPRGAAPIGNAGSSGSAGVSRSSSAGGVPSAAVRSSVGQPGGAAAAQERSFYERSKEWIFGDEAEIGDAPVPLGAPLPPGAANELSGPENIEEIEKRALLAFGGGRDYPELETVPALDDAALLTKDKLHQAQRALEIDKQRAARQQHNLQREASEGESLLDAYNNGQLTVSPSADGSFDGSLLGDTRPPVEPEQTVNVVRGTQAELVVVE